MIGLIEDAHRSCLEALVTLWTTNDKMVQGDQNCLSPWVAGSKLIGQSTNSPPAMRIFLALVDICKAIATDLRNALENTELETAIQDTQNDTKVPKTGILDEPGALIDNGSNEDGDDGGSDKE